MTNVPSPSIDAAVVLAGGQARRMSGVDKAMLTVDGMPLLHRVLDAVGDVPVVVVGPPRPVPVDVTWTREEPAGGGPVAGLAAGLAQLDLPTTAVIGVLAADLAGITSATLARLRVEGDGAVLVDEGGREQWLIGVWRLGAVRDAMPADPAGRSLRSVLGGLHFGRIKALPGECVDVDTPADLRTLGPVTASGDLIKRLDIADAQPGAADLRARTYALLGTREVVDVGCGSGRAVAELGVGAIGVDPSEEMLAAARSRWPGQDFRAGGAYDLPLADASMGGYRADKVFHLLDDPAKALAEAWRVLRPGGRIVLTGQDWDALIIDSDDPVRTREIVHARADRIADPRAARRSRAWLLDAGCTDVTVEVHAVVFTDEAALPLLRTLARDDEDWLAEQGERARAGRLFVAVPNIITAATRP